VELHLVAAGEQGPFVVAIPGGPGFDHGQLRPGLDPLADGARVLYVDPRNTGGSPHAPIETWTLEQTADDVAETCAAAGVGRAVVFGHSAGGFAALVLALRHPGLVAGLILCNTSPVFGAVPDDDPPPSLLERAGPEAAAVAQRVFSGDGSPETGMAFVQQVAPFYSGPTHMDVPPLLFGLSGYNPEVGRHFFGALAQRYDVRPRLGEIAVPALVVCGGWDWVIAPVKGRILAAGLPDAELLELPSAGHFSYAEEPEAFLAAARNLIRRS
jgi:proline iminopeptidase